MSLASTSSLPLLGDITEMFPNGASRSPVTGFAAAVIGCCGGQSNQACGRVQQLPRLWPQHICPGLKVACRVRTVSFVEGIRDLVPNFTLDLRGTVPFSRRFAAVLAFHAFHHNSRCRPAARFNGACNVRMIQADMVFASRSTRCFRRKKKRERKKKKKQKKKKKREKKKKTGSTGERAGRS